MRLELIKFLLLTFTLLAGSLAQANIKCPNAIAQLTLDRLLKQTFDDQAPDYFGDVRRVAWDAIHLEGGAYREVVAGAFQEVRLEFPELLEAEFSDFVHRRVWTAMVKDKVLGHRLPTLEKLKILTQEVVAIQRKYAQP